VAGQLYARGTRQKHARFALQPREAGQQNCDKRRVRRAWSVQPGHAWTQIHTWHALPETGEYARPPHVFAIFALGSNHCGLNAGQASATRSVTQRCIPKASTALAEHTCPRRAQVLREELSMHP